MQKQTNKSKNWSSLRIKSNTKNIAEKLWSEANNKKVGRTIKIDEIVNLSLGLVTKEHIQLLQKKSISNEEKKELLRQVYIKKVGKISKDEFTGFVMSPEFSEFKSKYATELENL